MGETIQPGEEYVKPQLEAVPDEPPNADKIKYLEKEIKRLKELEGLEKNIALAKEKERLEQLNKKVDLEKTETRAKYLAAPPVADFNPDSSQIKAIKEKYQDDAELNARPTAEKKQEKGWKGFLSKLLKREQPQEKNTESIPEKLSQFQDLVKELPKEAQKDGLAEYLAYVFESTEEAKNLLSGPHSYDGKGWREGYLAYNKVDHINTEGNTPDEPGKERLIHAVEQRRIAQTERRPALISSMKRMEKLADVEPPIKAFQEAFGDKQSENEDLIEHAEQQDTAVA